MEESVIMKPISPRKKKKMKEGTEFVWLDCPKCGCKFEVTEEVSKRSLDLFLCFDCFDN